MYSICRILSSEGSDVIFAILYKRPGFYCNLYFLQVIPQVWVISDKTVGRVFYAVLSNKRQWKYVIKLIEGEGPQQMTINECDRMNVHKIWIKKIKKSGILPPNLLRLSRDMQTWWMLSIPYQNNMWTNAPYVAPQRINSFENLHNTEWVNNIQSIYE